MAAPRRSFTIVAGDFVKTGGMDRANYAFADYLNRLGADVELVAHRAEGELAERPHVGLVRVPKPLGSYLLGDPLLDRAGRRAAAARRSAGGVTVVNGGNCVAAAVNWVHYVHAAYRPELEPSFAGARRAAYGVYLRRQERLALRRAELVIANSEATRRAVIDDVGVEAARVAVVHIGLDAALFAPSDADTRARARAELGFGERAAVAFVGALGDRRKGFDTVFDAWRSLVRNGSWDVDLVAVGAGSALAAWRARVASAGLGERIRLLGFRRDVPRVLAACDALVAPARYEPFGLGALEAIAKALPTFVSAHAGVAELYPAELRHVLIDDPASADELARKLLLWRDQREAERAAWLAFSERVRRHDWDAMSAAMLRLIDERAG
ncbi:MAG TPA: glycosyltransferase family 4 protein [Polyangiaceae bacterium]|nr:glycosyltransferase family 4 protein [Polyangiaceae bacterium]